MVTPSVQMSSEAFNNASFSVSFPYVCYIQLILFRATEVVLDKPKIKQKNKTEKKECQS